MAYTERDALKERLIQLEQSEIRILKMYSEERELIYMRLRELDDSYISKPLVEPEKDDSVMAYKTDSVSVEEEGNSEPAMELEPMHVNGEKQNKNAKVSYKEKEKVALKFMQRKGVPVKPKEVAREVEGKLAVKISNPYIFVNNLIKNSGHVEKSKKGYYSYVEVAKDDAEIGAREM